MSDRNPPPQSCADIASARQLAEANRRLEGIVDSAMDAIITIDSRNRIILFNPAAEVMFGVPRAEALGEDLNRFLPERYRALHDAHVRQFRDTGATARRMGALGAISGLRANGEEFPIEASISQVEIDGEVLGTVILRDITERKANEESRLILAREVDHRAKNALAVVQALVALTSAPTTEAFVAAVRGRVAALARAHSLLAQSSWKGADLARLIMDEVMPYQKPGQVRPHGPDIMIQPNAVQPISLIVHELATNAIKYGALSSQYGRINVDWWILADGRLRLDWQESGGPPTSPPRNQGFGSTLINTVGARQLHSEISVQWPREGVKVSVILPYDRFRAETLPMPADRFRSSEPEPQEGRLLLVEDELLVAIELSKALREYGWEIIGPAATLDEAYALLAEDVPPDAAVLDVNLNGEMVYPLADLLDARGVPFLFCSGYEALEVGERFVSHPVVRKPTSLAMLMSELRRILPRGTQAPMAQAT